jgi:hypothetical protein
VCHSSKNIEEFRKWLTSICWRLDWKIPRTKDRGWRCIATCRNASPLATTQDCPKVWGKCKKRKKILNEFWQLLYIEWHSYFQWRSQTSIFKKSTKQLKLGRLIWHTLSRKHTPETDNGNVLKVVVFVLCYVRST